MSVPGEPGPRVAAGGVAWGWSWWRRSSAPTPTTSPGSWCCCRPLGGAGRPDRLRPSAQPARLADARGGYLFAGAAFATQWVESGTRPARAGRSGPPTAALRRWSRARSRCCCCCPTAASRPRWRPVAALASVPGPPGRGLVPGPGPAAAPDWTWPIDPANPVGVLPAGWAPGSTRRPPGCSRCHSSWASRRSPSGCGGRRGARPAGRAARGCRRVRAAGGAGRALWPGPQTSST